MRHSCVITMTALSLGLREATSPIALSMSASASATEVPTGLASITTTPGNPPVCRLARWPGDKVSSASPPETFCPVRRTLILSLGTLGGARDACVPAACLSGALRRVFGAAQQALGRDPSHTTPAGCGWRRNEDRNPVSELGKAARPRLRGGYGELSSATAWAEGSAQTRYADAVAPGFATCRFAAVALCASLPLSPRSQ
jgi:hypothetical protein